ncbi:TPA: ATP-dependent helicase [Pseudomonas aeruginosa]|uniref:ATP-dependent helicase n=2 Tax=Pseudomonas TaxID=286 RepID=UPI002E28A13C|nr:ATP-dependent helicase [Pseudomonas aeruginosa]HBP4225684.1 ATP-dependent helicase [Pseudomonas aeruginosa]HBP4646082.1 ATP-dependent helicase [Pseudomonas aeruginosa]HBP4750849.1 ATP-dependent helicase [Pseudomonas aeruginosa]
MSLTDEQREAVSEEGNLLLTACPGSGKTRTLIAKALREIEKLRESPRRVCCITYTNSAAQEIEERARLEMQDGDELHLLVSTIHSFCLQEILRPYGWLLPGFIGGVRVLTRDNPDFEEIANHAARSVGVDHLGVAEYEAFEALSLNAAGELIGSAARNAIVARAAPAFWQRCIALGYLDFCSIIYRSYLILRDHPLITSSLCAKYAWFLVDEFQDTTELQIEILRLLYQVGRSRFFLVGDLAQSIYAFTGARPELVLPFGQAINARLDLTLSQNFRSSAHIVEHAERLFPRNPPMTSVGRNRAFMQQPVLIRDVSNFVAITEHFLPMLTAYGIPLGKATILGREWRGLIDLARELRDFGTPVVGPGARPYRRSRLFASLAEQLCAAVEDTQPGTMRQLERAVFHTVLDITGQPRLDVFSHEGRVLIIRMLHAARRHAQLGGALAWLEGMSHEAGSLMVEAELIDRTQSGLLVASVQEMRADMARQNIDVANLQIGDLGLFANPATALRLSTIHYAKGREFEAVAIIDVKQGKFPDFRSRTQDAIDGDKRLLYVGLTRAEKLLLYISDRDRWANPPSIFLGPTGVGII